MNTVITPDPVDFATALQRARNGSRYVQRLLDGDSELLQWLHQCYSQPYSTTELAAWLADLPISDEKSLSRALRQVRKRTMLKVATRDLCGLADVNEVMACMTDLAELCLQQSQAFVMQALVAQYGQPIGASSGLAQELLIVGMGKLGGRELNVSSDIDLIFVYPEDGVSNGKRAISNHEFFSKLGRRLIALIGDLTEDGYVFRVDMRLRPYGDSGPLAMSFMALEEYLVEQGREWERYAWIKARVVSAANSHARSPLPNPLDETTSHSTRLPKTAAKSLVIPQAGRGGKRIAARTLQ